MTTPRRPLRVLVTNDDGPPTNESGSSPYVYPFVRALQSQLGWEVRVVVPSTQKSWVGKSYAIADTITGSYFYPEGVDGTKGERLLLPRTTGGEEEPAWILIDGTPATCANLALYSLYPEDSFDLIISGPNYGRNSSTAFALSSGTIGAALAASQSGIPSIALSFGLMTGYKPPGAAIVSGAITAACKVVEQLVEFGWGEGDERVDVYSVNIPLLPEVNAPGGMPVHWTLMARTQYKRLFKSIAPAVAIPASTDTGGPSAVPETQDETAKVAPADDGAEDALQIHDEHLSRPLRFVFAPDIGSLVNPTTSTLLPGTDTHTIHSGGISVTPIRAAFEPAAPPARKWRL